MHKIFVTDYFRRQISVDQKVLGGDIEVTLLQELDEKKLFPAIEEADAIIVDKTQLTSYTLSRLPRCRIIMRLGVGYDNVDFKSAGENGIYVCNVPDFCTCEVAEHAALLMLALLRNLSTYSKSVQSGNTWSPLVAPDTARASGKTIGIVGLGRTGSAFASICKGIGMKILYYDPYIPKSSGKKFGAKRAISLNELARKSEVVSLHVPLNDETRHLIGEGFFKNLKKGAVLINTSRGGVVDTNALMNAMENGVVSKAGLDVLEKEPIDYSHPLFAKWLNDPEMQKRLAITPHAAFYSEESTEEVKEKMVANIKRVLAGKKPLNCVNLEYFRKRGQNKS